jgi:hypothetical protein
MISTENIFWRSILTEESATAGDVRRWRMNYEKACIKEEKAQTQKIMYGFKR